MKNIIKITRPETTEDRAWLALLAIAGIVDGLVYLGTLSIMSTSFRTYVLWLNCEG